MLAHHQQLHKQQLLGVHELLGPFEMASRTMMTRARTTERAPATSPRHSPSRAISAARLLCAGCGAGGTVRPQQLAARGPLMTDHGALVALYVGNT